MELDREGALQQEPKFEGDEIGSLGRYSTGRCGLALQPASGLKNYSKNSIINI